MGSSGRQLACSSTLVSLIESPSRIPSSLSLQHGLQSQTPTDSLDPCCRASPIHRIRICALRVRDSRLAKEFALPFVRRPVLPLTVGAAVPDALTARAYFQLRLYYLFSAPVARVIDRSCKLCMCLSIFQLTRRNHAAALLRVKRKTAFGRAFFFLRHQPVRATPENTWSARPHPTSMRMRIREQLLRRARHLLW